MDDIASAVDFFKSRDVLVLSPSEPQVVDRIGPFLFVASDRHRSVRLVQDRHFDAIAHSDFLWLTCPDGYVGLSARLEVGFAAARGVPIYSTHLPTSAAVRQHVQHVSSIDEAVRIVGLDASEPKTWSSILLDPAAAAERAHEDVAAIQSMFRSRTASKALEEVVPAFLARRRAIARALGLRLRPTSLPRHRRNSMIIGNPLRSVAEVSFDVVPGESGKRLAEQAGIVDTRIAEIARAKPPWFRRQRPDLLWVPSFVHAAGDHATDISVGSAIARGVPIYSDQLPEDLTYRQYVDRVESIDEAIHTALRAPGWAHDGPSLLLDPVAAGESAHRDIEAIRELLQPDRAGSASDPYPFVAKHKRNLGRILATGDCGGTSRRERAGTACMVGSGA